MIACNATGIGFVASKKEEKDSCRRGTCGGTACFPWLVNLDQDRFIL